MNELVVWELRYVGECFLLGAGLMLIYDVLRIKRLVVLHPIVLISIEDVLYWLVAGVLMFLLLYKEDAGSIRWFAVAVTALGMFVYNFGISRFAVPFIAKCIRWPVMQIIRFAKIITLRIKTTGKMVTVLLKKFYKKDKIDRRTKRLWAENEKVEQINGK